MNEPLVFLMGRFPARIPTDRQYATNHMWAQDQGDGWRFGFTAYAVRLMQEVYFLDWLVDEGMPVQARQEIGAIESKKAEAALYAPLTGRVTRLNDDVLADPSLINQDSYGPGWLLEIQGSADGLMPAAAYRDHLKSVWRMTQRMLKGPLDDKEPERGPRT